MQLIVTQLIVAQPINAHLIVAQAIVVQLIVAQPINAQLIVAQVIVGVSWRPLKLTVFWVCCIFGLNFWYDEYMEKLGDRGNVESTARHLKAVVFRLQQPKGLCL